MANRSQAPSETPLAGDRPASELTGREVEVAQLVGKGLSNKQIANRLVISRRTVESHVAHTRAKLGLNSRAEVAAIVVDWAQRGKATTANTA